MRTYHFQLKTDHFCAIVFFCCMAVSNGFCSDIDSSVEAGVRKYREAVESTNPEKKAILLNEALAIYLPYAKEDPSGKLLSNIGDVYYSFGQYGYAIGYYRRALVLQPKDKAIEHNLQVAVKSAQVENVQISQPFFEAIGYQWWAPNERRGLALGLVLVTFFIFSLNVWMPLIGFSIPWRILLVCSVLYVGPMLLCAAFQEMTAVVLRAAPLRNLSGPRENVMGISVDPGEMVYVEGSANFPELVRVRTVSGICGGLSREDLMFIEK
jgi:hypothetical protein